MADSAACRHGNRDVNYDGQVSDSFQTMTSEPCWVVACLRSSVYIITILKVAILTMGQIGLSVTAQEGS